ncbi:MAG: hypothetical protein ACLQAT_23325 [Candidatus Binataceae bacterium]
MMIVVATLLGCDSGSTVGGLILRNARGHVAGTTSNRWAFYGLVTRAWGAISAPLMLAIAARYEWAISTVVPPQNLVRAN